MAEVRVRERILQVHHPDTRWLSTGWDGGFTESDCAYNVTVPDGWARTDIDAYVRDRRTAAGFDRPGPSLLTGVEMRHARGARLEGVCVVATVGLSNPAVLPMDPPSTADPTPAEAPESGVGGGTVNLLIVTDHSLTDAALAGLLAVGTEAKTATLLALSEFPGTTTDAVVVGCQRNELPGPFSGSATDVGTAARACVREAVWASFEARYADRDVPASVAEADHGVVTTQRAQLFHPADSTD